MWQILSACLKSYAHGANDTANAAGPFAAVQALYLHGLNDCASVGTPLWVLAFCGLGIVLVSACWHGVLFHRLERCAHTGADCVLPLCLCCSCN